MKIKRAIPFVIAFLFMVAASFAKSHEMLQIWFFLFMGISCIFGYLAWTSGTFQPARYDESRDVWVFPNSSYQKLFDAANRRAK
jgi:hypothetical protein